MVDPVSFRVGMDGGGTSCRAGLEVAGAARIEAAGGPANVTSDFGGAIATVTTLLDGLRPGAARERFALFLGLAGVSGPAIAARVEAAVRDRFPRAVVRAAADHMIMMAGALGSEDGALIGVGTGSFVARQCGGQMRSLGGRGLVLGDQASGGWLGLRLMQEVMLTHDGLRDPSPLAAAVLAEHGHDPARMTAFARAARPSDLAGLAPRVLDAAHAADPLATDLMREGAGYLAAALAALGWRAGEPLCLGGGLGRGYLPFLGEAQQRSVIPARGTALDGALLLARRLAEGEGA